MNFNSGLTKILVEVGAGIVSGMLIEILLEILSLITILILGAFFIITFPFATPALAQNSEKYPWTLFLIYSPFLLIKIIAWLISSWSVGKIGNSYLSLGNISILVAGVIGFYTLVYSTLYEASLYTTAWEDYQIKSFLENLPMPPFLRLLLWIALWTGILKKNSS